MGQKSSFFFGFFNTGIGFIALGLGLVFYIDIAFISLFFALLAAALCFLRAIFLPGIVFILFLDAGFVVAGLALRIFFRLFPVVYITGIVFFCFSEGLRLFFLFFIDTGIVFVNRFDCVVFVTGTVFVCFLGGGVQRVDAL
ncbi:hypothetical protein [Fretibacterium sp. OH1220_COT-178]|uniref:hypothetical protein n=1 Tax=Fretibacterium sp. OH1220_COT-178 TaxID=2491047 RepID=UPI000F5EEBBA|nr:hypothetical protein [Fretibacterium sp. OH1220_COT-178]RRD65428.1 hypothetical protein EII26_03425 [Fretibacterium sp. OH1220_COT-178]